MTNPPYIPYTGKALRHYHPELKLDAYLPSPELVQAVEIARLLRRPLLLRGEPGCGKTRLAEAIAVELHGNNYREHYFPWPIKSTTKAQDGLYQFDHLGRMQQVYAQREGAGAGRPNEDLAKYVQYGAIGKAYRKMDEPGNKNPAVILIDEIDKADIDFPNDLLWELDRREFWVSEIKDAEGKDLRVGLNDRQAEGPIVIITSNDEKELPNAFLRRCLFFYIEFPKGEALDNIVREYLRGLAKSNPASLKLPALRERFEQTRESLAKNPNAVKLPSTSELLDWSRVLLHYLGQPGWEIDAELNLCNDGEIRIRPEDILLKNRDDAKLVEKG